ncbi:MAG: putative transport system permease protein, partial [Actinomycetota bacterium]|nr:putative transport system permease protein [Actinomycetota bacterium]
MFRIAVRTLRRRRGGFVATLLAMSLGAAIVIACGCLLESGLRTAVPPERLAAASLVVAGRQTY